MSDEALAALEQTAKQMEALDALDARIAYGKFAQLDSEFHDQIAAGSGN